MLRAGVDLMTSPWSDELEQVARQADDNFYTIGSSLDSIMEKNRGLLASLYRLWRKRMTKT